jgi:hypothetical protein
VRRRGDLTLVPPAGLKLDLSRAESSKVDLSKAEGSRAGGSVGRAEGRRVEGTAARSVQPSTLSPTRGSSALSHTRGSTRSQAGAPSWWTARAREGEVKPGFTKAEILRPAKEDPRAPGGLFERVGGLLSELLEQV